LENREKCICWLEKWLPEDLNDNVRILSLSCDYNIVASVHNDETKIGEKTSFKVWLQIQGNFGAICFSYSVGKQQPLQN